MQFATTSDDRFAPGWLRWSALLLVCSAYLQGALAKLFDFAGGVAEMRHFGLEPAPLFTVLVIGFELVATAMVLAGRLRWLGALALALFTVAATCLANPFWNAVPPERLPLANAFFEHWGLAGAFLLIAWHDLRARHER